MIGPAAGTGRAAARARRIWDRFWFELELPAAAISLFRVAFFSVLAVDAFLQIEHAPRYGAGDFNVPHIPGFDVLIPPGRSLLLVLCLAEAYLAARIALGVAIRRSLVLLTALYAYTYFVSQLDAYQHHYLVFLLLLVLCFVPWHQAAGAQGGGAAIKSWAIRLLVVQIALVYAWAALAKLAPRWLDGTALQVQIQGRSPWLGAAIQSLWGAAAPGHPGGFAAAAKLILATEILLVLALVFRRAWPLAPVLGVPFHLGIQVAGFRIGLFSYFLLAFYALLLPNGALVRAAEQLARLTAAPRARLRSLGQYLTGGPARRGLVAVASTGGGLALISLLPFSQRAALALLLTALAVIELVAAPRAGVDPRERRGRGLAVAAGHILACAALVGLHLASDQAFAYYRNWGGAARRFADRDAIETAYRRLSEIRPGYHRAYYHLGELARREGDLEKALLLYQTAQSLTADDPSPAIGAALVYRARGDLEAARRALRQALAIDPASAAAHQLARALGGAGLPGTRQRRGKTQ